MPAPCLLSSTVLVFSEKTLPSVSLPTRRISISLGIRLLRRIPSGDIRSVSLRGNFKAIVLGEICFRHRFCEGMIRKRQGPGKILRSEEHTSELQSLAYLVCRLL